MSANRKVQVYAGPALDRLLKPRPAGETAGGRVNMIAGRYLEVVQRHTPELSEGEWNALRDVLNGYWLASEAGLSIGTMWAEVEDAVRLNGLNERHDVDGRALAARLRDMPFVELVAIVEAVERWWGEPGVGSAPPERE